MNLEKLKYDDLSGKAKETWNFQKVSALLVEYGFATNWLNVDFESADFVAVHFNGNDIIKVQLKSRVTISKKYVGKDIYVCFPLANSFCLIQHEELIELVGKNTNWLNSSSWVNDGAYSSANPNKELKETLNSFLL